MLVSVIIPCYNQGDFLNETLESVFKQTYSKWECILVDDGSTDNTKEIANLWIEKDTRFKYFYKQNGGVSSARNFGIRKAVGSYFQFLDSDDILGVNKIEYSLNQFKKPKNSEVKMVISNFKMISFDSKVISPAFCQLHKELFTLEDFLFQWNITFSLQIQCGFFEASLFKDIKFPENLSAQEDWIVWVQLMKTNSNIIFIDKPLVFYRTHPQSRMSSIGIGDNHIKVLESFKTILTYWEYHELASHLLNGFYTSNIFYRNTLINLKKSNTYQVGLMIKKILKKIGILKQSRFFFKIILKFKSK